MKQATLWKCDICKYWYCLSPVIRSISRHFTDESQQSAEEKHFPLCANSQIWVQFWQQTHYCVYKLHGVSLVFVVSGLQTWFFSEVVWWSQKTSTVNILPI